ncbi:MAG TPA: dihydrodipicolinate synthase family protein [Chryseolinea sp.]|nr:dihydrodipicolinate synthase family protein [Chryseolinea sp.]
MKKNLVEILCATFTPMLPDGSLNLSRIPDLYSHCHDVQANGIFLNGTTGECMSLSTAERIQLADGWMDEQNNRRDKLKVVVHVGSSNLMEAASMAEHAQSRSVNGIAMVPTFYFRPKDLTDLVNQCVFVAAAAPSIPFYYYNIPSLTGVNFPMIRFIEQAAKRIPNFAGIKNSFNDLVDYQHCLHYAKGKYALYWGTDEVFTMLYAGGNRHYVGSTYNYMNALYLQVVDALGRGDSEAIARLQADADAIYHIILAYNNIISGKEVMRFLGVDCGPVRRPLNSLTPSESETLFQKLKATPLFAYTPKKLSTTTI